MERNDLERLNEPIDDNLLARVEPEVVNILGEEVVLNIERHSDLVIAAGELARSPNPFNVGGKNEVDFSFLKPEELTSLQSLMESAESLDFSGRIPSPEFMRRAITTIVRLEILGSKVHNACLKSLKQSEDKLKLRHPEIMGLVSDYEEEPTGLDLKLLEEHMRSLAISAEELPSTKTLLAAREIFATAEAITAAIQNIRQQLLFRLKVSDLAGNRIAKKLEKGIQANKKLAASNVKVNESGKLDYELLRILARDEEAEISLELLKSIDAAKGTLPTEIPDQLKAEQKAHLLMAEEYLISKTSTVVSSLRGSNSQLFEKPEFRKAVDRLQTPNLARAEQAKKYQSKLEKATDFNKQVTEAREILVGGRRLESTKDVPEPQEKADDLHRLRLLSTEENGIVMAILVDQFNNFLSVLERIQADAMEDEVLRTVTESRSSAVKSLFDFKIESHITRLGEILHSDNRQKLLEVLTEAEIAKVETALVEFLQPKNTSGTAEMKTLDQPRRIEDLLYGDELFARLDWTVLPVGEYELEKAAREIVADAEARAAKGTSVAIDLERLNILKRIREMWGSDKCYYARGQLSGRRRVYIEGQENPDEYIVLVLQQLDGESMVLTEHAIAESPIAGHNALYILRGDVSTDFSWRDIYSLPKEDAREFGARRLKHTKAKDDNRSIVEVMTDRVAYLLRVQPEEFTAVQFHGRSARVVKSLGGVGIRSQPL